MKKVLRVLLILVLIVVVVIGALLAYVNYALPNVGPAPDMQVEITPERIERGRYLAEHVMQCMECHAKRDFSLFAGPPIASTLYAGGERFDHSLGLPGVFISPNITPHGIGDWTDGELFRLITSGVKRDGEPIFPIMPYPNFGKMDAEDIKSVIAFLRTLDPVVANHPPSKADFPVNLIMRTLPQKADHQPLPPKSDELAYGLYMVNASACGECHTKYEKGAFTGEFLAGGREFIFPDGTVVRSANLTFHETGLAGWTREMFINQFHMYADTAFIPKPVAPGDFQTPMPWITYAGMTEQDLSAIYTYLKSLDPIDNFVDKHTPPGM